MPNIGDRTGGMATRHVGIHLVDRAAHSAVPGLSGHSVWGVFEVRRKNGIEGETNVIS